MEGNLKPKLVNREQETLAPQTSSAPAEEKQAGKADDLTHVFRQVTVGKRPARPYKDDEGSSSATAVETGERANDEDEAGATRPWSKHPEADANAAGSRATGRITPVNILADSGPQADGKGTLRNLPRVAGENEATAFFALPNSTAAPHDSSLGSSAGGVKDEENESGFTQLLHRVSSRKQNEARNTSRTPENASGFALSQRKEREDAELYGVGGAKVPVHTAEGTFLGADRQNAPPAGVKPLEVQRGVLERLLPWLVLLNLVMTSSMLAGALYLLFSARFHLAGVLARTPWAAPGAW